MSDRVWVVIPAGGQGVRACLAVPKQFQELGGVTVLERTVSKVVSMPEVAGVVVALPDPSSGFDPLAGVDLEQVKTRLRSIEIRDVPVLFASGGATRQESVYSALKTVPPEASWIAVHDASRPFVSQKLFREVVRAAKQVGAAISAVTPTDTVKTTKPTAGGSMSLVGSTLERDSLVSVQTPQVFAAAVLRQAHEEALINGVTGTDDSRLVELLGHEVAIVTGERTNLKLTYPEDFAFGRALTGGVPAVGLGFDVHPLVTGRRCVIGGVDIPSEKGLLGHSDADVLCHAVMDSVLGALSEGDIGQWFPDDDPKYRDASSIELMSRMWGALRGQAEIVNVDAMVIAEAPKIMPHAQEIRKNIAGALGTLPERVSVKATTAEKLGTVGRGDAIVAFSVALLRRLGV